jgi:hypothetical protein
MIQSTNEISKQVKDLAPSAKVAERNGIMERGRLLPPSPGITITKQTRCPA